MREATSGFQHEALLYTGDAGFFAGVVPFVRAGVARGEPVLVVVDGPKIAGLRHALDGQADSVEFADMRELGANPARIIPRWREFLDRFGGGGRRVRGVGEPIGPARSEAAIHECQHHEALLNIAFADSQPWMLLCPYDMAALDGSVIDEARRSHPRVSSNGHTFESGQWPGLDVMRAPCASPLPAIPRGAVPIEVERLGGLRDVRRAARRAAMAAGCDATTTSDFTIAVDEIVANSVLHGGGRGLVHLWIDDGAVVCDVRDHGVIGEPLVGRVRPRPGQVGGRGLWLVNQLCDLVQIRTSPDGNIVRFRVESQHRCGRRFDPATAG